MTKETTANCAAADTTAVVKSDEASATNLTAYQNGPAVVRENRVLKLGSGKSRVFIGGLPSQFVEGSSTIVSVKGTGKFKLGAKSMRPANLSHQALLHQSIGSKITFIEEGKDGKERPIEGELCHIVDGRYAVLKQTDAGDAVLVVPLTQKFKLNSGIPAGLSNLTVLVMEPTVETAGEFDMKLLYETNGINWTPWFEVFYNAKTKKLDRFACYVDITNNSGAKIENAVLKLIAGTNNSDAANRAARKGRGGVRMAAMAMSASLESAGGGGMEADFSHDVAEVESVGEQKMYKLVDPVTLENGVPNSPALVFCTDVPVEHEYHAHAGYYQALDADNRDDLQKHPVMVKLRLLNSAAKNLGQALPPGSVRIFEPDSAGEMQKTDSSQVTQHVAVDEAFALDLRTPCKDLKHTRELIAVTEDPAEVEDEVEVTPEGGLPDTDDEAGDDATEGFTARPMTTGMMPAMSAAVQGGPGVGTPEHEGARRRRVAEGASTDGKKNEKKKPKPRFREEEREIVLHNYKDEAVDVIVHESVPYNAEFLSKSQEFAKFNAGQGSGSFKVTVPAKGEKSFGSASVRYRIKYRIN